MSSVNNSTNPLSVDVAYPWAILLKCEIMNQCHALQYDLTAMGSAHQRGAGIPIPCSPCVNMHCERWLLLALARDGKLSPPDTLPEPHDLHVAPASL